MDASAEQTELLRNIWNEMKALNGRIDTVRTELSGRLDAVRTDLSERIDQTNARLDQTNVRVDTLRTELKGEMIRLRTDVTEMRRDIHVLGGRIDNLLTGEHRAEHGELRQRVERIEKHLGLESESH